MPLSTAVGPCASHMVTGTSHRGDRYFTLNYLVCLFKVLDPHYKPAHAFSLTIIYGGEGLHHKGKEKENNGPARTSSPTVSPIF